MMKKTQDERFSLTIVSFFILQNINASIKSVFNLPSEIRNLLSPIVGMVFLCIFFANFKSLYRQIPSTTIKTLFIFILVYAISIFQTRMIRQEPINVLVSDSLLWTFAFWIPVGLCAYAITDKSEIYRCLYKYSFLNSVLMLVPFVWYIVMSGQQVGSDYNMYFSYSLIVPAVIHLNEYINRKKTWIGFLALIEILAIVFYGSRGAILCIGGYFLLNMIFAQLPNRIRWSFFFITLFSVGVFFLLSSNLYLFESIGLHSRLFQKINDGTLSEGRDYVFQAACELIKERPWFGYGLGGEYYQMSWKCGSILGYFVADSTVSSLTPHNGFLEMMICFGLPIGVLLSFWLLFSIRQLRKLGNSVVMELMIILFSVFLIPALTVADGIFIKPGIAIYIFITLSLKKRRSC